MSTATARTERTAQLPQIYMHKEGGVATITLNRPEKLNAVTREMGRTFFELAREVNEDDDIHVVVVTGTGERAFCAGSDIKLLDDYGTNWQLRNRSDYCYAVWNMRKPVIAQVRGYCIGGGLELALMSDIRIASETAKFGAGEVKLGWNGGAGNTQLLPRLVGYGKALQMLLTGNTIDAQEAYRTGLVQEVVPDGELEFTVRQLADIIAQNPTIAVQSIKHLVRVAESTAVGVGLAYENDLFAYCMTTEDAAEGREAFVQKRKPNFKGR